MRIHRSPVFNTIRSASLLLFILSVGNAAFSQPAKAPAQPAPAAISSESDIAETRTQLMHLLRMSPTLSDVVGTDPSLLANQEYVSRTNPELARFLQNHPEVVRNPDFYLFADLPNTGGRRGEKLVRRTWDEGRPRPEPSPLVREISNSVGPFLALFTFTGVVLWLTRAFLENRRWSRVFKMQSDVHARLIERFGNNEELLTYMNTDAGKRFLEAAPIPVEFERDQRVPAALSRVLIPLQAGLVLTLLGIGLLALRGSLPEIAAGLLVFGTVILMPGLGFILSAGVTWLLASRFGLMQRPAPHNNDAIHDSQASSEARL
jgi:hypothetical protein